MRKNASSALPHWRVSKRRAKKSNEQLARIAPQHEDKMCIPVPMACTGRVSPCVNHRELQSLWWNSAWFFAVRQTNSYIIAATTLAVTATARCWWPNESCAITHSVVLASASFDLQLSGIQFTSQLVGLKPSPAIEPESSIDRRPLQRTADLDSRLSLQIRLPEIVYRHPGGRDGEWLTDQ